MGFRGYTVPPVVAGILLTSCITHPDPPCLELELNKNRFEITASNDEKVCIETTYTKNQEGFIQPITRRFQHNPSRALINTLVVSIDGNQIQEIPSDSFYIHLPLQVLLEPGLHSVEVLACIKNYCSQREMPVYSYGLDFVVASAVSHDKLPPRITTEFIVGKTEVRCKDCRASDLNGIIDLTIIQGNKEITQTYSSFQPEVDYSSLVKLAKLNPKESLTIIAEDATGKKTSRPVSFDGTASSYGEGGQ